MESLTATIQQNNNVFQKIGNTINYDIDLNPTLEPTLEPTLMQTEINPTIEPTLMQTETQTNINRTRINPTIEPTIEPTLMQTETNINHTKINPTIEPVIEIDKIQPLEESKNSNINKKSISFKSVSLSDQKNNIQEINTNNKNSIDLLNPEINPSKQIKVNSISQFQSIKKEQNSIINEPKQKSIINKYSQSKTPELKSKSSEYHSIQEPELTSSQITKDKTYLRPIEESIISSSYITNLSNECINREIHNDKLSNDNIEQTDFNDFLMTHKDPNIIEINKQINKEKNKKTKKQNIKHNKLENDNINQQTIINQVQNDINIPINEQSETSELINQQIEQVTNIKPDTIENDKSFIRKILPTKSTIIFIIIIISLFIAFYMYNKKIKTLIIDTLDKRDRIKYDNHILNNKLNKLMNQ